MRKTRDIWFHGSPFAITRLRKGSTITQDQHLAEVFSHKPSIVSLEEDGTIRHNGKLPGTLYIIAEPIDPEDIIPVRFSTMEPGKEWQTQRDLQVKQISNVIIKPEEALSTKEIVKLQQKIQRKDYS
jgi:hypothetical protein